MRKRQTWKSLLCAVLWAPAMLLPACGGGGDGNEPVAETSEQCYDRCVSASCAGTSGNGRLLCTSSCANTCRR